VGPKPFGHHLLDGVVIVSDQNQNLDPQAPCKGQTRFTTHYSDGRRRPVKKGAASPSPKSCCRDPEDPRWDALRNLVEPREP